MSYILDALKKSEQQRLNQSGSLLADTEVCESTNSPSVPATRSVSPLWFLLPVAAAGLFWLMYSLAPQQATEEMAEPETLAHTPESVTEAAAVAEADLSASPVPESEQVLMSTPESDIAPVPDAGVSEPASPVEALLPPVMRDGPALVLSGHVYSSDPRFRAVNINGTRLREGDALDGDVRILEITQQGVVYSYKERRLFLSLNAAW